MLTSLLVKLNELAMFFLDWWMALGMWSDATRSGKCKQDRLGGWSLSGAGWDQDDSHQDQLEKMCQMVQAAKKSVASIDSMCCAIPGFAYHLELQVAGILSCSRPVGLHCHGPYPLQKS